MFWETCMHVEAYTHAQTFKKHFIITDIMYYLFSLPASFSFFEGTQDDLHEFPKGHYPD